VTNPDGTTDIQGFVRGRWLSLSQDDPKNLFVNGFEISSVSPTGVLDNVASVNDHSAPAIAVQIIAGDTTQNFAVVSLQDASTTIPNGHSTYWYKCNLLDCSQITGPVSPLDNNAAPLVSGIPSFTVNSAGVTYALALGATGGLNLASLSITAASAPGTNFFSPITIQVPAIPPNVGLSGISVGNANGASGSSLINPLSIQLLNPDTLHAVYFQPSATAYYGDSSTLFQCNGQLTIATPTAVLGLTTVNQEAQFATGLPAQFAGLVGSTNIVIGPSYVLFGVGYTAVPAGRNSGNVLGAGGAVAIWTPQNIAPAQIDPTQSGPITFGTSTLPSTGETVFVVQWSNMVYVDGTPAFSGQVQLSSTGAVFIEVTSSQPPTANGVNSQRITQGNTVVGPATRLSGVNNPPATPNSPYCYNTYQRSMVYLTCPTNPFAAPCSQLPFAWGYVPVTRHVGGPYTTGLYSLDADPTNALHFVFSGLFTNVLSSTQLANEQLAIFTFTATAAGGFYRPAPPVLIDMGGSEQVPAQVPAVDFDAEYSAAGTWMAIVGLRASSLEPFPWSYRVLSFPTFPTTAYQITSARILVTSIDLDTNGESTPFGAAKITKRGNVNYATILIGSENLGATADAPTAGVPVIFRSVDDAFTQVYAAFPNPYHAITSGAVTLWPHVVSGDVSVLSVPAWRQGFNSPATVTWGDYPTLTRYTNGFLSPNAQLCNSTVAGKFYTVSSRTYACAETVTQDLIWTRSGIYTWAPVGTYGMRRHFARPNDRAACA